MHCHLPTLQDSFVQLPLLSIQHKILSSLVTEGALIELYFETCCMWH